MIANKRRRIWDFILGKKLFQFWNTQLNCDFGTSKSFFLCYIYTLYFLFKKNKKDVQSFTGKNVGFITLCLATCGELWTVTASFWLFFIYTLLKIFEIFQNLIIIDGALGIKVSGILNKTKNKTTEKIRN